MMQISCISNTTADAHQINKKLTNRQRHSLKSVYYARAAHIVSVIGPKLRGSGSSSLSYASFAES